MIKNVFTKFVSILLALALVVPIVHLSHTNYAIAAGTYYETLTVGKTKYISGSSKVSEAVNSGAWSVSGNSSAIRITEQTSYGCTIEAVKPTNGKVAILFYEYNYIQYINGFPYIGRGFLDYEITVNGINATSISLSPSSLSLSVGDGQQLTATMSPSNATSSYTYSSSDTSVAKVSNSGYVTAVGGGTARITAITDSGVSDYCSVTVSYPSLSLSSVSPSDGAIEQSTSSVIKFTYNTSIAAGSAYDAISLKDNITGENEGITKSISGSTLTITPMLNMQAGHSYTATVPSGALKNPNNVPLADMSSTTFTTKAVDVLEISPENGASDIEVNAPVTIKYNGNIQKGTNWNNITIKNKVSGEAFPFTASISGDTITVKPNTNYRYSTQYELTIPAGAIANGEGIETSSALVTTFTTKAGSLIPVSTSPVNNSSDCPVNKAIEVTYGYDISKGAAFGDITLTNTDINEIISGTASISEKTLTFMPSEELEYENNYMLYIPDGALVNSSGEGSSAYTLRFKTVRVEDEVIAPPEIAIERDRSVSITAEKDTSIYYTTDNTDPALYGILYESPFIPDEPCTIRAVAVKNGNVSDENTLEYKVLTIGSQSYFGGSDADYYEGVTVTSDGGFVAVGYSASFGNGDWAEISGNGYYDAIIVKYDSLGNVEWKKNFGGSDNDYYYGVAATSDGGFVAVGHSYSGSFGNGDWAETSGKGGYYDAIIVKYDALGNIKWKKNFGGSGYDIYYEITAMSDGGVIAVGRSNNFGNGDWLGVSGKGDYDAIIVKYDALGNIEWKKNFGGSGVDYYQGITSTSDGGFVAVGTSEVGSFRSGDWSGVWGNGYADAIIVKYDSLGNVEWKKNFGGSYGDNYYGVTETSDGEFVAVGYSLRNSFGNGNWSGVSNKGVEDAIIVKYNPLGTVIWKKNFGTTFYNYYNDVVAMSDGGVVAVGCSNYIGNGDWSDANGKGGYDSTIVKYDSLGNVEWNRNFGGNGNDSYNGVAAMSGDGVVAVGYSASFGSGNWAETIGKGGYDAIAVVYKYLTLDDEPQIEVTPVEGEIAVSGKSELLQGDSLTCPVYFAPYVDALGAQITLTYPDCLTYNEYTSDYNGIYVAHQPSAHKLTITGDFAVSNPTLEAGTDCIFATLEFDVNEDAEIADYEISIDSGNTFIINASGQVAPFESVKNHAFAVVEPPEPDLPDITIKEMYIWGSSKISAPSSYRATFFPAAIEDKEVEWSVSDTNIAEIDENGLLTPHQNGTVTVIATHTASGLTVEKEVVISGLKSVVDDISFSVGEFTGNVLYVEENTESVDMTVTYTGGSAFSDELGFIFNGVPKTIVLDTLPKTVIFKKSASGLDDTVYTITIMLENDRMEHIIKELTADTDNNSVTAEIQWGQNPREGIFIAAAYDGAGRLISISHIDVANLTGDSAQIPIDLTNAKSVSVFMWNSLDKITPISLKKSTKI